MGENIFSDIQGKSIPLRTTNIDDNRAALPRFPDARLPNKSLDVRAKQRLSYLRFPYIL